VSCLLNLAELYRMQGDPDLAEPLYARALEAARQAFRPDHPRIGTVLSQMAVNRIETGAYAQAEALLRESAEIKVKEWGPDAPDLAHTYHEMGLLLARLDRVSEAEDWLRRALAIREQRLGSSHPTVALSLLALAEIVEPARPGEALDLLDRAVRMLDTTPAEPRSHARALARRAALRDARGQRGLARADLDRALDIVEGTRPEAGGAEQARARFLSQYVDDFQRMVGWRVEEGDLPAAIRYAERARGRVLLDQLAVAGVDLRAGIDPGERRDLEARETEVRARLAEYRPRLEKLYAAAEATEAGRAEIAALEKEQAEAILEFERLYDEIRNASRLWRGRAGLGDVVGLADIQRELVPRGGLVLYYSVGGEGSFLFVIPPPGQRARAWPLQAPAAAAAGPAAVRAGPLTRSALRQMLAPAGAGSGLLARLAETPRAARRTAVDAGLHALFEALMPRAVWPLVREAAEVVIVPDDLIHQVPFEALVVRPASAEAPTGYWLDVGPTVRYAASATVAHALALRSPAPRGSVVLSVSDPVFDRDEVRRRVGRADRAPGSAGASPPLRGGWDLERLPGTARETEAIRAAFAAQGQAIVLLQQLESRESAVRSHLPSARYVHLATHGLVDESGSGLFASLALTPPPAEAGPDDDGQLQLFEIYALGLSAELAVLSSCETRVGTVVPGEGVFALSRAFLAAGARRVVASLWPADDDATAALMGSFFRGLARSERLGRKASFARALAEAKREVRRRAAWSEPFFWAPFLLDGAP
jgi:CHAT domain-containing protein/tetratricopeptide (TPR) repeat protein